MPATEQPAPVAPAPTVAVPANQEESPASVEQEWLSSIQASPSELEILKHLPPLETSVSFPSVQPDVSYFLTFISTIFNNHPLGPAPRIQLLGHRCYRGLYQCSRYSSCFQCHDEPDRDTRHLIYGSREPAS